MGVYWVLQAHQAGSDASTVAKAVTHAVMKAAFQYGSVDNLTAVGMLLDWEPHTCSA